MKVTSTGTPPVTQQTVLVCGSLHLDVVVEASHLPRKDETVTGSSVNYICGGKGGNQAVAAALNGARTSFAGCTGDDEFGRKLTAHLLRHNIDYSQLQTIGGASGMSVAIVDGNGDYGAVIVPGANLKIDSSSIEFPESTGILLLQNEISESVNSELARQASTQNIPVMLNAAPYRSIPARLKHLIDILVLNRVEAEQYFDTHLTCTTDVTAALKNADSSISMMFVTLGKDGLVYRDIAGQIHEKTAFPVTVSSSPGAGDMFCGALASRIIDGVISTEALDYAMAAAAWYVGASLAERSAINHEAIQVLLAGKK
ncbi:MAG: ribokinase [Granulosicoccus sp.]|nr:ribokinase [Granulosicoccus sp.]